MGASMALFPWTHCRPWRDGRVALVHESCGLTPPENTTQQPVGPKGHQKQWKGNTGRLEWCMRRTRPVHPSATLVHQWDTTRALCVTPVHETNTTRAPWRHPGARDEHDPCTLASLRRMREVRPMQSNVTPVRETNEKAAWTVVDGQGNRHMEKVERHG